MEAWVIGENTDSFDFAMELIKPPWRRVLARKQGNGHTSQSYLKRNGLYTCIHWKNPARPYGYENYVSRLPHADVMALLAREVMRSSLREG